MGKEYVVERSTEIAAQAATIYPKLDHMKAWREWSPWDELDPDAEITYSGPESGAGAGYTWRGNRKMGEGQMTVTDAKAPTELTLALEFLKPFKSSSRVVFSLAEAEGGTRVTWTMYGQHNWFTRLFGFIFNMDKMIGKDFERGLAKLKQVVEA